MDEGGRALQIEVAADASPDEELADLALEALGVGNDRTEVDDVGQQTQRRDEFAWVQHLVGGYGIRIGHRRAPEWLEADVAPPLHLGRNVPAVVPERDA